MYSSLIVELTVINMQPLLHYTH